MIIANNFILPHARNTLSCSQIQYVIDQLRKTTGWKMVVKQLSKEGRHLKSRAAPDIASASNGLTDSSYCSTCLSTSLTITSLSPPHTCILSIYWWTVTMGCTCTCTISPNFFSVQSPCISFSCCRRRPPQTFSQNAPSQLFLQNFVSS